MELFKLFGKVAIDNAEANSQLDATSNKAAEVAGKIGSAFANVGKVVAAGMAAGVTAVGALTKAAVESYAEYEQLVGGVETLFKDSSGIVQEYADNAYKTAGMSANDYMTNVTGFSASLLQGLHGDTAEAARVADMAITDMADNANKMGTPIENITVAYQGFAKQNYTMLDNLKLGYGGTKAEMERLLADATKLTGVKYDINNLQDVYTAIHVIQGELGITGTTAKEAESTISGSINMMKASWANLLVAFADGNRDIGPAIDAVVHSATVAVSNLIPVIGQALSGIGDFVQRIAPIIAQHLPGLVSTLLPKLLSAALSLVQGVVSALPGMLQAIVNLFPILIQNISAALHSASPALGNAFDIIFQGIATTFGKLKSVFESIKPVLQAVGNFIINTIVPNFDKFAAVIGVVITAVTAFKTALNIASTIQKVASAVSGLFSLLAAHPIALVVAAVAGLVTAFITLYNKCEWFRNAVNTVWNAIKTGITALWNSVKPVIESIANAFKAAVEAIKAAWNTVKPFFQTVWNGIKAIFAPVVSVLSSYFKGAWESIKTIWSAATGFFKSIFDAITGIFKVIKSVLTGDFKGAWDGVKQIWSAAGGFFKSVFTAITAPFRGVVTFFGDIFTKAYNNITGVFGKIGGFFSNLWQSIKNAIKLPHFSIDGSFSLVPPKVPHLSVQWYAKAMKDGMILNQPTIFGYNPMTGDFMGGGEAGSEAVIGVESLNDMIRRTVSDILSAKLDAIGDLLAQYLPLLLARKYQMALDYGVVAGEITPYVDEELQRMKKWKEGDRA